MKSRSPDGLAAKGLLLRPITVRANSVTNQSKFLTITYNLLKAWEKLHVQGVIDFASHWLKNWFRIFKPALTRHSNKIIANYCVSADESHLKMSTDLTFISSRHYSIQHNLLFFVSIIL